MARFSLISQEVSYREELLPDSLVILASRIESKAIGLPYSALSVDLTAKIAIADLFSANELLQSIPGIYASNSMNQTQDTRISIRGFGSRSAFGIRGIKILVDGVPETTPDGQGQLDNLVINALSRMEVMKSAQSSLYGNASGGLIAFYTHRDFNDPYLEVNSRIGEYGYSNLAASGGMVLGQTKLKGAFSILDSEGFRDWSNYKNRSVSIGASSKIRTNSSLDWNISYTNSPIANDPGGLTLNESTTNRASASSRNKEFIAGENIQHFKSSIQFNLKLNPSTNLKSLAYYSIRDFSGLLPFETSGYVELYRKYGGGSLSISKSEASSFGSYKSLFGMDLASQSDHRERFDNLKGSKSIIRLDQIEGFDNFGIYLTNQLSLARLNINGGLRYDINSIALKDMFIDNGDESGQRSLNGLSYSLGINYKLASAIHLFSNISSSFETPALSELSSAVDGGFDPLLTKQDAFNFELGFQNAQEKNPHYSFSSYYIKTKNEIIAYELAGQNGRIGYRNAGETERKGVETNIEYQASKQLKLSSGFDINNIQFLEYIVNNQNLKGNKLPGIPHLNYFFSFDFRSKFVWLFMDSRINGRLYADDLNKSEVVPVTVVNLRIGTSFRSLGAKINPFIGVNNLFSEKFFDNIRINAFGGRYYEPATRIYILGGIKMVWNG